MKNWNEEIGLKMISLEEENTQLRQQKRGIKQSTYSNYSVGELVKSGHSPDKISNSDQMIREIHESTSSMSKKTFSNEAKSPQNSIHSSRPATDSGSDTFSNFQALETIPENTDENLSMNRTKDKSPFNELLPNRKCDIHLSMPVYHEKDTDLHKQPKFMFNSLQKKLDSKISSTPSFPDPHNAKNMEFSQNENFMFRTGETGANYNPFRKTNDIDIEIESETSGVTKSKDRMGRDSRYQHPDEVRMT